MQEGRKDEKTEKEGEERGGRRRARKEAATPNFHVTQAQGTFLSLALDSPFWPQSPPPWCLRPHLLSPAPRMNPLLVNEALEMVTGALDQALPFLLQKIVSCSSPPPLPGKGAQPTPKESPPTSPNPHKDPLVPSLQVCPMATTLLNSLLEDLLHISLCMLVQTYPLSLYCVPGTVLGSAMVGHKTHPPCPQRARFRVGERKAICL